SRQDLPLSPGRQEPGTGRGMNPPVNCPSNAMFFSAYLGAEAGLPLWSGAVDQHACWLGLVPHIEQRLIAPNTAAACCWMGRLPLSGACRFQETTERLLASTLLPTVPTFCPASAPRGDSVTGGLRNSISITVSVQQREMCIIVPPA